MHVHRSTTQDPLIPWGTERNANLHALRGLAAASVLVFHLELATGVFFERWWAPLFDRLNVAVAVFFTISGYLIYRPFVQARRHGRPAPAPGSYLIRRALRILPLYWLTLTLFLVWPGLVTEAPTWTYFAFLQVFSSTTVFTGNAPAWSLCMEVLFYLSLPVYGLLLELVRRRKGLRESDAFEAGLLISIFAIGLAGSLEARATGAPAVGATVGTIDWFAVGLLIATLEAAGRLPRLRRGTGFASAALVYALLVVALPRGHDPANYSDLAWWLEHYGYIAVAGLLVWSAASPPSETTRKPVLAHPWLAGLGTISYGVFLWHFPITLKVADWNPLLGVPHAALAGIVAITVPLVLLLATASWFLVERPALNLGRRLTRPSADREQQQPVRRIEFQQLAQSDLERRDESPAWGNEHLPVDLDLSES
jgi:peptidoglycan/LPS O-acetylase OafA/YrhL